MRLIFILFLCASLSAQTIIIGPSSLIGPSAYPPGATSVAFDATANKGTNSGTSASFNITIGSGSNRAIGIGCSWSAKVTGVSVTVGGVTANAVSGTDSSGGSGTAYMVTMFALAAPASGVQSVAISWTTAAVSVCGAVSVTGADQTTPMNNGTFARSTSGIPTVDITSNTGDLTLATLSLESGSTATGSTQTEKWNVRQAFTIGAAGSIGPGTAGPITHAWATTGSEWELAGANFKHA